MKTLRIMIALAATATLAVSCLSNDDPHNAGFIFRKPTNAVTTVYANTQRDTISFYSYGAWTYTIDGRYDGRWCTLGMTSGAGSQMSTFPLSFEQNTTGEGRGAMFTFTDATYPDEARATLLYWQYATRGDGSLGSAPDVKTITGSDGSLVELDYDQLHRPTLLTMSLGGTPLHALTLTWNDRDSTLTVHDGSTTLRSSSYGNDYQPMYIEGGGDTVSYVSQRTSTGYPIAANTAFNLSHRRPGGSGITYAYKLGGQSLLADSLHCADSLRIATVTPTLTTIEGYKLEYTSADNRYQSVDVNQLILGISQCDPYQLLSLFRYCRSTSIVSRATSESAIITTSAKLNADRSVSELTVTAASRNGSDDATTTVTYTFDY